VIISVEAEVFNKIQLPFMTKSLKKLGIEVANLNVIDTINGKPTANIMLNGKKMKTFSLRSEIRSCSLSQVLFNIVSGVIARAIKVRERNKTGSQFVTVCRCMILHIKNPKVCTKKL
jgi:hypothetical protein